MKKTSILALATFALSVLLAAPTAKADHHENLPWWDFLVGSWTVEYDHGAKGEVTYKMATTGKALIGEWRVDTLPNSIEFNGMEGSNLVLTGYTSDGGFWRITISDPKGYKQEGIAVGGDAEDTYSGTFVAEKISEDQMKAKLDAKFKSGKDFNLRLTMTRKK